MDKKKLLIPASGALLALGIFGATAASADTGPAKADATAEAPETAAETVEANEPALPGGGHADINGQNVDYQFDGVE